MDKSVNSVKQGEAVVFIDIISVNRYNIFKAGDNYDSQ